MVVKADDAETLAEATELVEETVRDIPGAADVRSSIAPSSPPSKSTSTARKPPKKGLTEGQIGQAVTAAFQGTKVGTATVEDVQHDMVLRVDEAPATVKELENLRITTPTGSEVKLSAVAEVARSAPGARAEPQRRLPLRDGQRLRPPPTTSAGSPANCMWRWPTSTCLTERTADNRRGQRGPERGVRPDGGSPCWSRS